MNTDKSGTEFAIDESSEKSDEEIPPYPEHTFSTPTTTTTTTKQPFEQQTSIIEQVMRASENRNVTPSHATGRQQPERFMSCTDNVREINSTGLHVIITPKRAVYLFVFSVFYMFLVIWIASTHYMTALVATIIVVIFLVSFVVFATHVPGRPVAVLSDAVRVIPCVNECVRPRMSRMDYVDSTHAATEPLNES